MTPELTVVVPSRDRPIRLRWLLNALEEQTLDRSRWRLVVVHDSAELETDKLLATHPLSGSVDLQVIRLPRGSTAASKRTAGLKAAGTRWVAFTHDDCRPPARWLEIALRHALKNPAAILAGPVRPHPDEVGLEALSSLATSKDRDATKGLADGANAVYPTALIEGLGGFPEALSYLDEAVVRDRAKAAGVKVIAVDEMVTFHAVVIRSMLNLVWRAGVRSELPHAVALQPRLRRSLACGVADGPSHILLAAAFAGLVTARHRPATVLLAAPWAAAHWHPHSRSWRGVVRSLTELPGEALVQAVEVAANVHGSLRNRSFAL